MRGQDLDTYLDWTDAVTPAFCEGFACEGTGDEDGFVVGEVLNTLAETDYFFCLSGDGASVFDFDDDTLFLEFGFDHEVEIGSALTDLAEQGLVLESCVAS